MAHDSGPRPSAAECAGCIDHPSGFFAVSPSSQLFRQSGLTGFVSYRKFGWHLVCFGGVHAPPEMRRAVLDAFLEHAAARRRRVLVVQLRANQADLFVEAGFTVNRLGSSYSLALADFTYRGTPKMKLRNKIKRARKAGVVVGEVGTDLPRDPETFDRLRSISSLWLGAKKKKELDFMIGEIGEPSQTERRVFVAQDEDGVWQGFITYVPVWGERPGYLHDLTRKRPDAPVGTMELINSTALDLFQEEGVGHLHFGFTPFVVNGDEPTSSSPLVTRAVEWLCEKGEMVYPAKSQVSYKMKWGPDHVEDEYLAGRPIGPAAIWSLLRLTPVHLTA